MPWGVRTPGTLRVGLGETDRLSSTRLTLNSFPRSTPGDPVWEMLT